MQDRLTEERVDKHVPGRRPRERVRPDERPAGDRRQDLHRPRQDRRLRLHLPADGRQARADRHARRLDLGRDRVERVPPPPRLVLLAGRLRPAGEPGRQRHRLDRGDRAPAPDEVAPRHQPLPRPVVRRGEARPLQPLAARALDALLRERRASTRTTTTRWFSLRAPSGSRSTRRPSSRRGRSRTRTTTTSTSRRRAASSGPTASTSAGGRTTCSGSRSSPTTTRTTGSRATTTGKKAGTLVLGNHHVAPGKKFWTWGSGDHGQAWDKLLTDSDGPELELMAGGYSDNEPDYSWLQPHRTKEVSHYFYPLREIGSLKNANLGRRRRPGAGPGSRQDRLQRHLAPGRRAGPPAARASGRSSTSGSTSAPPSRTRRPSPLRRVRERRTSPSRSPRRTARSSWPTAA